MRNLHSPVVLRNYTDRLFPSVVYNIFTWQCKSAREQEKVSYFRIKLNCAKKVSGPVERLRLERRTFVFEAQKNFFLLGAFMRSLFQHPRSHYFLLNVSNNILRYFDAAY